VIKPAPFPLEATIPDLSGLTTAQADQELQAIGLLLYVNAVGGGHDKVVLTQTPAPGAAAELGSRVTVTARCYPPPCPAPPPPLSEDKELYDPCTCSYR
jgi:hypothetical protein